MIKRGIQKIDFYITAFKEIISKPYGGFLIISSGDYYLQMCAGPDMESKNVDQKIIFIEAVSHYYLPEMGDLSEQFKSLGFEIDFFSGNFSMECSIDLMSDDYLKKLANNVFAIYGIEIPPYNLEWFLHDSSYTDSLLPIKQFDDTIPGIDIKHKIVYQGVSKMDDGGFIVKINDKCGCIDKDYNPTLPCIYDSISLFSTSRALVERNSKYGYIDEDLQEVIPCIYEYATDFVEGKAWVLNGNKWGLIDLNGSELLPFIYDVVGPFSHGVAWVKNDKINAIINQKGEIIKNSNYEDVTYFQLGHARVRDNNDKYGIIDESYELVVPLIYDSIFFMVDGYICGLRNGAGEIEKKYMSFDGSVIRPADQYYNEKTEEEALEQYRVEQERINRLKGQYDSIWHFSEGLSRVRKDGQYGFIDADDIVVIPLIYPVAKNFSEGLAVVKNKDKYGYINQKGELVIDFQFNEATGFYRGYGLVRMSSKRLWGAINKEGKLIVDCKYQQISEQEDGFLAVYDGQKWGCFNKDGIMILPISFDHIHVKDNYINAYIGRIDFCFDYSGVLQYPLMEI